MNIHYPHQAAGGPHFPGQMPQYAAYPYGPMPYHNPWPNYAYQQQGWPEPDPPKAASPPSFGVPEEVKKEASKNLDKITDKIVAQLNPTRKEGPVMGPSVVKVLKMVYEPK
jgi:hypothetical protein